VRWRLFLAIVLPLTAARAAEDPAEAVLRHAPPDAAATLVVPSLREHARELLVHPLAGRLRELPAWKAWVSSDAGRTLDRSRAEVEELLGVGLATIRDELLGDAAALTMRLPPGAAPEAAEGMLLTKVRDRKLLDRLVATINAAERDDGTLDKIVERRHRDVPYFVRIYREGMQPDEFYAVLNGDVFAWTNSETLLRATIDRQASGGGLAADPRLAKVRAALPARPLASLYIDPRALERLAPPTLDDDPAACLLRRYLGAIDYAGAAVEWRDGPILHIHESLDPSKLDEPLRRWAARPGGSGVLLRRVPPTAPVLATGHVDFAAAGDLALGLVPEADRTRAENVLTALQGIFLGLDIRADVLPRLGPGWLAYVDAPGSRGGFPLVVALGLGGSPEDRPSVGAAVENALRTLLALAALDAKVGPNVRLASQEVHGVRVTSLVGGPRPVSYAIGPGFVAVGTTAEAVGAFAGEPPAGGNPTFDRLRETYFPDAETYACADLTVLHRLATERREALVRHLAADRDGDLDASRRELNVALDFLGLFRATFATSRMEPDASAVHRTIGLIAHGEKPAP
jgi:hypothetical protein